MATTARRDGDHYVVNGAKTFITNGIHADLVITAVKTDPAAAAPRDVACSSSSAAWTGFTRGRKLDKLGQHAQDTAELFFDDVRVPVGTCSGRGGPGLRPAGREPAAERLSIAIAAWRRSGPALELTLAYVKERKAFGQPIGSFQTPGSSLAEMATELDIAQHFVDDCVRALNAGELTAEEAAKAKWWSTEPQGRVDRPPPAAARRLRLHERVPDRPGVADARVTRIYGGTTEIMKEIMGRDLGL